MGAQHELALSASWDDYVSAHGGTEASGWWVTLRWVTDAGATRPEVVGPYASAASATDAMENALLIDGFASDPRSGEYLDDIQVESLPATIGRQVAVHVDRVTLIDPGDPHHFGLRGVSSNDAERLQGGALQRLAFGATPPLLLPPPPGSGAARPADPPPV